MRLHLVLAFALCSPAAADEPQGAQPCQVPESALSGPVADVRAFGAVGDGIQDDSAAIERAMMSLPNGGIVQFSKGTYLHNRVLIVDRPGVTLTGGEATLLAGNPAQSAIFLSGDGSGLRDIGVTSAEPGDRGNRNETTGIAVMGRENTVMRVRVSKSKSAGIIVLGAKDFLIACSTVSDTKADGIHVSQAARNGRILSNSVWNSEDDGIAVVSYRSDAQSSGVVIEGNAVEHIRWGRGIAVVGSKDVIIRRNRVKSVAMAAGIIVAREVFWNTYGADEVLIEENEIADIQQSLAPLGEGERTGQAAIDINSDDGAPELAVSNVRIVANSVRGSGHDGIRLNGNVRAINISGNSLQGISGSDVTVVNGPAGQRVACADKSRIETCAID